MRSLLVVLCLLLAGPVWGEGRTINGEVFERSEDTYNITEDEDGSRCTAFEGIEGGEE
jgi:hypothetical protein